ncbi:MAG TPA: hypothetical protein VGU45_01590 [Microvirga sp.]|jgi:hypothetical protein|nr:hypothetical protein [Microvirga sp.]
MTTLYAIIRETDWSLEREALGYVKTLKRAKELVEALESIEEDHASYHVERIRPFNEGLVDELRGQLEARRAHMKALAEQRRQEILNAPMERIKPPTDYMKQLAAKMAEQDARDRLRD